MPNNYTSDFVVNDTGENVVIINENTQNFGHDDFLQVYEDTIQNLENLQGNLEDTEEEMADMLDEKEDAMNILHTIVNEVETGEEGPAPELEKNSLTIDDLNAFMQLQQKQQQAEQQRQQIQQIEDRVEQMRPVAEKLAEDEDDLPTK